MIKIFLIYIQQISSINNINHLDSSLIWTNHHENNLIEISEKFDRIPSIKSLWIENLTENNHYIKYFLLHIAPLNLKRLEFKVWLAEREAGEDKFSGFTNYIKDVWVNTK